MGFLKLLYNEDNPMQTQKDSYRAQAQWAWKKSFGYYLAPKVLGLTPYLYSNFQDMRKEVRYEECLFLWCARVRVLSLT